MKHQESIQQLFNEITEIMKLIQEHPGDISKNMTPEVVQLVKRLKNELKLFRDINRLGFRIDGVDIDLLKKQPLEASSSSQEDLKVLESAKEIGENLRKFKKELSQKEKKAQKPKVLDNNKLEQKKLMKKRRNSFKSIGGDDKWVAL